MAYSQTTIQGFPAFQWKPDNVTGRVPVFIFIPGIGEVKNSTSTVGEVNKNGPGAHLVTGWKPTFAIICVQTTAWPSASVVDGIVNAIAALPFVDSNKIYGTGLSHGGKTWLQYALWKPEYAAKLAGMVIMSSPGVTTLYNSNKANIKHLPIRFFHGTDDVASATTIVSIRNIYHDALALGYNVKMTEEKYGHCCWNARYSPTYVDPVFKKSVYNEMLQFSKTGQTAITTTTKPAPAPAPTTTKAPTTKPVTTTTKVPTTTTKPPTTTSTTKAPTTTTTTKVPTTTSTTTKEPTTTKPPTTTTTTTKPVTTSTTSTTTVASTTSTTTAYPSVTTTTTWFKKKKKKHLSIYDDYSVDMEDVPENEAYAGVSMGFPEMPLTTQLPRKENIFTRFIKWIIRIFN